jgi:hypothetical protein
MPVANLAPAASETRPASKRALGMRAVPMLVETLLLSRVGLLPPVWLLRLWIRLRL